MVAAADDCCCVIIDNPNIHLWMHGANLQEQTQVTRQIQKVRERPKTVMSNPFYQTYKHRETTRRDSAVCWPIWWAISRRPAGKRGGNINRHTRHHPTTKQHQTTKLKQITRQKQTTRQHQATKQAQILNRNLLLDRSELLNSIRPANSIRSVDNKQTTRPHPTTKQAQILNKPVEFDALVPFVKVWGSNSAS